MLTVAEQAAARFEMPAEWGRYHTRWHICVDGRNYSGQPTCLVTDPAVERVARYFMTRGGVR
jgi:hypothetical protein